MGSSKARKYLIFSPFQEPRHHSIDRGILLGLSLGKQIKILLAREGKWCDLEQSLGFKLCRHQKTRMSD